MTPPFDGPLRESDGRPTSESILDRRYTTQFILDEELSIVDWADERWSAAGTPARLPDVGTLDAAQAHAASLVAGTHPLVVVVGPAGTGKTTMLRAAVESLDVEGRRTFGLAPSRPRLPRSSPRRPASRPTPSTSSSPSTTSPGGSPTRSICCQRERRSSSTRPACWPHPSSPTSPALADHLDWRVVLVGDPLQFSAVGRGGMFQHLIEHAPEGAADRAPRARSPLRRRVGGRRQPPTPSRRRLRARRLRATTAASTMPSRPPMPDARSSTAGGNTDKTDSDVVMLAATNESVTAAQPSGPTPPTRCRRGHPPDPPRHARRRRPSAHRRRGPDPPQRPAASSLTWAPP